MKVYLVDSSAWVSSFKEEGLTDLKELIKEQVGRDNVATTQIIILELLRGCHSKKEYNDMKVRFESLKILNLNQRTWEIAYGLGFELKRKGILVPTVDLLIASLCIENNCILLHHDKHFKKISEMTSLPTKDFM